MALTRARVVAGEASLSAEIAAVVARTLRAARDPTKLAREVREMRKLVAQEKGESDPWDLKLVRGGLMDIEFIAQFLILAHARERPELLDVSTRGTVAKASELGLLGREDATILADAHRLYTDATQLMRLTIAGPFDPAKAASGVKRRIADAAALPDFEALAASIKEARALVRKAYRRVLGVAAAPSSGE
jgi:glutamate-ammonia-ligase adenylyltransferase